MSKIHQVCIIGSGPAGYTAGLYTGRAMLEPILITGNSQGGQLMTTSDIENFPGYDGGSGPDMMMNLENQAVKFGTSLVYAEVKSIDSSVHPFHIHLDNGKELITKSIIIATGSQALWLNLEGEYKLRSRGVSSCAVCDGAFFKNEKVIVIGGGDTCMEDALFLTKYTDDVTIIHRSDNFRASKIMLERAQKNPSIKFKTCYTIKQWLSDKGMLCGAILQHKNGDEEQIECTGAFIAIGHKPATEFLNNQIELDDEGFILHSKNTMTSVPGIFAAGDCSNSSKRYKQAITASGEGCQSAMDVEKFLTSLID
jgi:thioredoxin reductase (NADPH)